MEIVAPVAAFELQETGTEPEFTVTDIPKWESEQMGVRLFAALRRKQFLRLEYTVLIPITALRPMAQLLNKIADDLGVPVLDTRH